MRSIGLLFSSVLCCIVAWTRISFGHTDTHNCVTSPVYRPPFATTIWRPRGDRSTPFHALAFNLSKLSNQCRVLLNFWLTSLVSLSPVLTAGFCYVLPLLLASRVLGVPVLGHRANHRHRAPLRRSVQVCADASKVTLVLSCALYFAFSRTSTKRPCSAVGDGSPPDVRLRFHPWRLLPGTTEDGRGPFRQVLVVIVPLDQTAEVLRAWVGIVRQMCAEW